MYLKSLELQGFKSFPDKIKIDFGKGLTAIVGPNGSGKSNIGDAVRWVLGEQSTKNLRGGKMEDVIFAGTQKRKSVGFASVTLNIDNSSRSLNIEENLVSVSRKLYRNGDSEYMINGKNVRLKDIVELFMDTGLGKDGYSIIGQGRVAEIVSNKSNERRQIFEEAAGISKFKYKKQEAEKKLVAAEENLVRLKDILSELECRVEPLRIQSEKAHKFIKLASEKKGIEVSLWLYKLSELKEKLTDIEEKFLISNGEYENIENDIEQIDTNIEKLYYQMQQASVKIEHIRTEILDTEKNNSTIFADIAVLKNDIVHIKSLISETLEKQKQSELSQNESDKLIKLEKDKLSNIDKEQLDINSKIQFIESQFEHISEKANEFNKSFEDENNYLNELYIEKSKYGFTVASGDDAVEEIKSSLAREIDAQEEINIKLSDYEKEKNNTLEALSNVEEKLVEYSNQINGYTKLLEGKSSKLKKAKEEYVSTDLKIKELVSKHQLISDLEKNMEGFAFSVKKVVQAGKSGRISGIYGSIAQLISVDSKYSLAIETALGGLLQNIVVQNEDVAKRGIRFLKEQKAGRATFLPITSVKGYTLTQNNLDMQEGFVSLASELVKYDDKFKGIISYLLGRIVIAENIDFATKIAKKYGYKFKIVTLDGQVINAGGSFTGGSNSKSTGVLTRKNELENISKNLEKLKSGNTILKQKIENYQAEVDKLVCDLDAQKDLYNNVKSDKIRFESELSHIEAMIHQINLSEKENTQKISELEEKLDKTKEQINESKLKLEKCIDQITKKEKEIEQKQIEKESYHSEREKLSQKLSELKLRQVELEKDKQASMLAIQQMEKAMHDNLNAFQEYKKLLEKYENEIIEKNNQIGEKNKIIENSKSVVDDLNNKISEIQKQHMELEKLANEQRNVQKIKNNEKETISREIAKITERKVSLQKEYDNIITQLWEQYQLTKSQAKEIFVEIDDIPKAKKRLNEIKSKIRNLGTVNVNAIEEYKEVSERYDFLSKQLCDVENSKKELLKLIEDLTHKMKIMFTESFNIINNNFKTIFVELFGGGKAELKLTDTENVLESGIEINVAPPGKVIKSLSLLSGGEQAFVAIAIYFAILKLRPSPFCILDEIEAALDDVNVSKYASYLRNFTDTTQFITITHRRGTMEEADVLYGVTMQEKGISKLLKMDTKETVNTRG